MDVFTHRMVLVSYKISTNVGFTSCSRAHIPTHLLSGEIAQISKGAAKGNCEFQLRILGSC